MNAPAAEVVAQAKVNLFLHVLAREPTGYHQVETLFCRLALGDRVRVRATSGGRSLDCSGPALPTGGLGSVEQNLAWRAAVAYADAVGWPAGFALEVEKHVPVGGGLGGGSADAGAVLRALNALAPTPLTAPALIDLGGSLGADVPFLTQDATSLALAWGRGDRLLSLPPLPARPCVLCVADFGVRSADAYRWYDESDPSSPGSATVTAGELSTWAGVERRLANVFERVVFEHVPRLAGAYAGFARSASAAGLSCVRMSGSGSCLFGLGAGGEVRPAEVALPPGFVTVATTTAEAVAPVQRLA